ncbi:MAG: RelA/SpoT domain-containing protein [Alphaproteobacteria bacterium]|nr:RelA/SpoT domain-containing protein [Alphaproteobacteria bacterium]
MLDFAAPTSKGAGSIAIAFRRWLDGASFDVLWRAQLINGRLAGFPGGSKGRVNRAGERVRDGAATEDDVAVIDTWREAHRHVINSFQAILRNRTRGRDIIVAQRHKRKRTIFDKLRRYPRMQLSRMDDVAGCRLIFQNIDELNAFRENFRDRSRFNHKVKNDPDKYDYIKNPKDTGYRGVHDVYEYDVKSEIGRTRKGLLIELQYRTIYQHAWATCVEVVGFITEDQPKFERGNAQMLRILRLASEIIARSFEETQSSLPDLSDDDLVEEFTTLDDELNFMRMLRGLNAADRHIADEKDVIFIFGGEIENGTEELEVLTYPSTTQALRALFELERENPGLDIVLVRGDRPEDVRVAFKNYFSDARQFIDLIDAGCRNLMADRVVYVGAEGVN